MMTKSTSSRTGHTLQQETIYEAGLGEAKNEKAGALKVSIHSSM